MSTHLKQYPLILACVWFLGPISLLAQGGMLWVQKVPGGGLGDPFAYNPQNHNTIFSAPGNNQIYRSTDRGRTWTLFSTVTGGSQITSICVHPRDTLMMLVGQEAGPPDRVMKTTNGGQTWFLTLQGNRSFYGRPIAYEPTHPELVYVACGRGSSTDSLWRSDDFGSTWAFVRKTSNLDGQGNGFDAWDCAVIRPDSSKILYVGDVGNGLWRSSDGGLTWVRKHLHSGEYPIMAIDRFNPLVAYSARWGGVNGFMKTTNGGNTWFDVTPLAGIPTWGMAVAIEQPGYVWAGTYGGGATVRGFWFSRDWGVTWTRVDSGLSSFSNYGMLVLDTLSVFALQSNGIWKLRMPGKISGVLFHDLNANGIRDPGEPGLQNWRIRLSGTRTDSVLTDINGAYEFRTLSPGSYTVSTQVPTNWFLTAPAGGSYSLTVVDGDQFRNTDFGVARRSIDVLSPSGGETWFIGQTRTIVWSSTFVTGNVTIELSRDGGVIFDTLFTNTPNDSSEIWLVTGPPTTRGKVRISSINYPTVTGTSLDTFTISLPSALFRTDKSEINFGTVQPGSSRQDSFMVFNDGIDTLNINRVVSTHARFTVVPESLSITSGDSAVFRVTFTPDTVGFYSAFIILEHNASTSPDSVRVRADVITSYISADDKFPQQNYLFQNYPNPFNSATVISYRLIKATHATLRVYNVLGQEVSTLLSEVQQPGYYKIHFDAKGLSTGIYYYRLQAGEYVKTRKFILLQ